jgi:uncharacterized protein YgiM (DUF1202 family)
LQITWRLHKGVSLHKPSQVWVVRPAAHVNNVKVVNHFMAGVAFAIARVAVGSKIAMGVSCLCLSIILQVTARDGLRLRAGPGTQFDIKTTLVSGQHVNVIGSSDAWSQIDIEGDGLADGYCHSGFLALE